MHTMFQDHTLHQSIASLYHLLSLLCSTSLTSLMHSKLSSRDNSQILLTLAFITLLLCFFTALLIREMPFCTFLFLGGAFWAAPRNAQELPEALHSRITLVVLGDKNMGYRELSLSWLHSWQAPYLL